VVAQEDDTLRSIAARVYGDESLWYLIADENGEVDPDAAISPGRMLTIPSRVVSLANNAESFKPFDIQKAIGDVTPTQAAPPPPTKNGCGMLGMLIVFVVVAIVSYYAGPIAGQTVGNAFTGGAASATASAAAAAAPLASTSVAGAVTAGATASAAAAVTSSAAYLTGYAVGYGLAAGIGSAIGQGIAVAVGAQEEISWKGVAATALTAGLMQGAGSTGLISATSSIPQMLVQGAVGSVVNQGVNIALGLQDSFSWRELAISSVSSAVAGKLTQGMDSKVNQAVVGGFASAAVRRALGGRVEVDAVLADVFANVIGNSIVDRIETSSVAPVQNSSDNNSNDVVWRRYQDVRLNNSQVGADPADDSVGTGAQSAEVQIAEAPAGTTLSLDDAMAEIVVTGTRRPHFNVEYEFGASIASLATQDQKLDEAPFRIVRPRITLQQLFIENEVERRQQLIDAHPGFAAYSSVRSPYSQRFDVFESGLQPTVADGYDVLGAYFYERPGATISPDGMVLIGHGGGMFRERVSWPDPLAKTASYMALGDAALNTLLAAGGEALALGEVLNGLGILARTGVRSASIVDRAGGIPELARLRGELRVLDTSELSTAQKGLLGENRASLAFQRAAYQELDAKLMSNNGFDGVFVKYGADGGPIDIIINESKFTSTGRASLSQTNLGQQMSPRWIDANIQKMMNSADPAVMETGYFLDANRSIIRTKVNVLNPQGINRWNVLVAPR
jgi:hypothetical protein